MHNHASFSKHVIKYYNRSVEPCQCTANLRNIYICPLAFFFHPAVYCKHIMRKKIDFARKEVYFPCIPSSFTAQPRSCSAPVQLRKRVRLSRPPGGRRILVLYGGGSVVTNGVLDTVLSSLDQCGITYFVEGGIPGPTPCFPKPSSCWSNTPSGTLIFFWV